MEKSAKLLTIDEINEIRRKAQNVWQNCNPTYMDLVDRLICDVSESSIPEPEKGKILLKIRQVGHSLQKY